MNKGKSIFGKKAGEEILRPFLFLKISRSPLLFEKAGAINRNIHAIHRAKALANLTPRERDFIPFMEQGYPNKKIASALKISEKTVEFHKKNITAKIDVRDFKERSVPLEYVVTRKI